MSLAAFLLLGLRSLGTRFRMLWWSNFYTLYLRCHPGVELQGGRITVTGRMKWRIDPRGRLVVRRNVRIHSGPEINAFGGQRRTIIWVLPGGVLTLGEGAGVSNSTLVCQRAITLGSEVMIGGGCDIIDTDFHPMDRSERVAHDNRNVRGAPVTIEDGAWICGNVFVLKGVTIGAEAVVGGGSVVTKSIPAGEIWAGNPATRLDSRLTSKNQQ